MRLIDADALLKHKSDHETISTHLIWNAPTVDAIPIEWIKNNYTWLIEEGKNDVVDVLTEMIEEWRKGKKNDNACNR